MTSRQIILGTLAYTLATFAMAVVWHVVMFEQFYVAVGYFKGQPDFALGLLTIFIQGAALCLLFPFVSFTGSALARGMKFAGFAGVFLWTTHVLAFVAKQDVGNAWAFVWMESLYLLLQFALFGVVLGVLFNDKPNEWRRDDVRAT